MSYSAMFDDWGPKETTMLEDVRNKAWNQELHTKQREEDELIDQDDE